MNISSRISQSDIDEFRDEFGEELFLEGASYDNQSRVEEFKYRCSHSSIRDFRSSINNWLKKNDFPVKYVMITGSVLLNTFDELSGSQIRDFEREFGIAYKGYSISCGSNLLEYEFS